MTPPASVRPFSRPAATRRRTTISLTPLIDVVFILLVFFMLASSFLDWRAIDLNAPAPAGAGPSIEGAMLVEVRPDGLRFAGAPTGLDDIEATVVQRLSERPQLRVLVKPAPGVPLQRAVAVLDRLAAAGVRELSLIGGR